MAHNPLSFAIAILTSLSGPVLADDRTSLEQRIEEMGSTSTLDSWPMSNREDVGYLLSVSQAQTSSDEMRTMFVQIKIDDCDLDLSSGFLQTGHALPVAKISINLRDPTVVLDLPVGDGSGDGFTVIQIKVDDPGQVYAIIPVSGTAAEVEERIRKQAFELRPTSQYTFSLSFPKDRPSTAPDLLAAIDDYKERFCLPVS